MGDEKVLVKGSLNAWTSKYAKKLMGKKLENIEKIYAPFLMSLGNQEMPELGEHEVVIQVGALPGNRVAHSGYYDNKLKIGDEEIELEGPQTEGFSNSDVDRALRSLRNDVFTTLTDDGGERVIAVICLNKVWIPFDAFSLVKKNTTYKKEVERVSPIAEYVLGRLNDHFKENPLTQETLDGYRIQQFTKKYFSNIEQEKQNLESQIAEYNRQIERFQRDLANSITSIRAKQKMLIGLDDLDINEEVEKLRDNLKEVRDHKKANSVELGEEGITIHTKDIRCNGNNLGEYKVILQRTNVKIYRVKPVSGPHHPHVSSDGTPCLGDFSSVIQYLADNQFEAVVEIMIAFLETYNRDSPYVTMETFMQRIKEQEE